MQLFSNRPRATETKNNTSLSHSSSRDQSEFMSEAEAVSFTHSWTKRDLGEAIGQL